MSVTSRASRLSNRPTAAAVAATNSASRIVKTNEIATRGLGGADEKVKRVSITRKSNTLVSSSLAKRKVSHQMTSTAATFEEVKVPVTG